MAQRKGQVAEIFRAWRYGTRKTAAEISGKRVFLAVQTVLVLGTEDEKPELFLALAQLKFQGFYRVVGCLVSNESASTIQSRDKWFCEMVASEPPLF